MRVLECSNAAQHAHQSRPLPIQRGARPRSAPPEADGVWVLVVQLGGVVVDHVHDHLDARRVQPAGDNRAARGVA